MKAIFFYLRLMIDPFSRRMAGNNSFLHEYDLLPVHLHADAFAQMDLAGNELLGEGILDGALDHPAQGARAVLVVEARLGQVLDHRIVVAYPAP